MGEIYLHLQWTIFSKNGTILITTISDNNANLVLKKKENLFKRCTFKVIQ